MLKVQKIRTRSILFTNSTPWGWDLNTQLILGDKYNYMIDTGLGSNSVEPMIEYIKNSKKPLIVINTHHHWDHIWGNGSVKDCMIISHKQCKEMIEITWDKTMQKYEGYVQGNVEMHLPNLTFEKEMYFPEDKIRILSTPGHTIDSISVLDEVDQVIHVGDNIGDSLEELIPSLYTEKEVYIDTLLKYKEMDFDTCISGHNRVFNKQVINKILHLLKSEN